MTTHAYWHRCREETRDALEAIPADRRPDVYVAALSQVARDEDPRCALSQLSWNTNEHLDRQRCRWDRADPYPRWSPSAFEGYNAAVVGDAADLRAAWVRSIGQWFEESEAQIDEDAVIEKEVAIIGAYMQQLVEMVRDLHGSGFLVRTFGHPVPMLVLGFGYDPRAPRWTEQANPPQLVTAVRPYFDTYSSEE